MFSAGLAQRHIEAGLPMCQTRYSYICALNADDKFSEFIYKIPLSKEEVEAAERELDKSFENFFYGMETEAKRKFVKDMKATKNITERAHKIIYSEASFELYQEAYEEAMIGIKKRNNKLAAYFLGDNRFNNLENILKYCRAVEKLLYNADRRVLENSIIKLTSWLQWFRSQFIGTSSGKLIDASALIFFSAIGGTGKSELLRAFKGACEDLEITAENFTAQGLTGRWTPSIIKGVDVAVVEDADLTARIGNDVNVDKLNAIIDRGKIDFEQKNKQKEIIQTKLTVIASTNNRFVNRRFSVIPLAEREVSDDMKAPSPEELREAWYDAIYFCPDHNTTFVGVKKMNQRAPGSLSEDMLKIYDIFEHLDNIEPVKSVRGIIRGVIDRDKETPRRREFILQHIRELIKLGVFEKESPESNGALLVSKVRLISRPKFQRYIGAYEESCDESQSCEHIIFKHYIKNMTLNGDIKLKNIEENIKTIENRFEGTKDKGILEKKEKRLNELEEERIKVKQEIERQKELREVIELAKRYEEEQRLAADGSGNQAEGDEKPDTS
jgi:hypothetical protein